MKFTLLITCPKCGYMINGRLWRCPGCGGAGLDGKSARNRKTRRGFIGTLTAALRQRRQGKP